MQSSRTTSRTPSPASAGPASAVVSPDIAARAVTDSAVLDAESVFREAKHQLKPLAEAGSGLADRTKRLVARGNARHSLLKPETVDGLIKGGGTLADLTKGRHPTGKLAEIVVAHDYKAAHAAKDPGIINAPKHSPNVVDVRLSPDDTARRDIYFLIEDPKKGLRFFKNGGQVKTGDHGYVASSLEKMVEKVGYGGTAYVDARYVNVDGTPRIAADGFTRAEAARLDRSGVRLRGIRDLDARATLLGQSIDKFTKDGMTPEERAFLQQFRDDIASAYKPRAVFGRVAGGAAIGAASGAIISLLVQAATRGEVDVQEVASASGQAALYGGGGAVADAALFNGASHAGMDAEAAKFFAQQGVAFGFCVIAIGADAIAEVSAYRDGTSSGADLVGGLALKSALDLMPLLVAPLGLAGIPIVIGAQIAGRWLISACRETNRKIDERDIYVRTLIAVEDAAVGEFFQKSADMDDRIDAVEAINADTNAVVKAILGHDPIATVSLVIQ